MTLSSMRPSLSASLLRRVLGAAAMAACVAGAAACGSTADQAEAAAPDTATAQAARAPQAGGHARALTRGALALTTLRADQRASITALDAKLEADAAPVREAHARLSAEVAQEIRAGRIDHATLRPLADQVAAAAAGIQPSVQTVTQQLHDTLDAAQRKELVASLRAQHQAGRGDMRAHFQELAAELGLTAEQKSAIHAQMQQAFAGRADQAREAHDRIRARLESLATAFEADAFDAKALDVGAHTAEGARTMMGMHGAFLDAAVPVLTPAQRAILADKVQARAASLEE
jgi:hypothetical protein